MKRIICFGLSILLLLALTCSKSSTSPDNKNPGETFSVGAEGGTVTYEDLTLDIPEGAFNSKTSISIQTIKEDTISFENSVTQRYRITGIPVPYSEPIQIKLKMTGPSEDEVGLAVGREEFSYSSGKIERAFRLVTATDSADYLIAEISDGLENNGVNSFGKSNADQIASFDVVGEIGYNSFVSNNLFEIIDMGGLSTIATQTIADVLDNVVDEFRNFGFDLNIQSQTPMKVYCVKTPYQGYVSGVYFASNGGYLVFNLPPEFGNIGYAEHYAAKALFAHVGLGYRPQTAWYNFWESDVPDYHWFTEAVGYWFESYFSFPEDRRDQFINWGDNSRTFDGIQNQSNFDAELHGKDMAVLVQYIVSQYGKAYLLPIFEKIKSGSHVVDAIKNTIPSPVSLWLEDFYRAQVLDQNQMGTKSDDYWNQNAHENCIVEGNFTNKHFDLDMIDMSAKIVSIKFNTITSTNPGRIQLNVSGGTKTNMTLFKTLDNQPCIFLDEDFDRLSSPLITDLIENQNNLLVIVTNSTGEIPYNNSTKVGLDIAMVPELPYKYCYFSLDYILADVRTTNDYGTKDEQEQLQYYIQAEGEFTGSTYNGSWNDYVNNANQHCTGTIKVELGEGESKINSLVLKDHRESEYADYDYEIEIENVNENSDDSYYPLAYEDYGESVCDKIVKYEYKVTRKTSNSVTEKMGHTCSSSELDVYFKSTE